MTEPTIVRTTYIGDGIYVTEMSDASFEIKDHSSKGLPAIWLDRQKIVSLSRIAFPTPPPTPGDIGEDG